MVIEIKEITVKDVDKLLNTINKSGKKTIAKHFGKLKRGIDGMEYQKSVRNEWD
ncbi:MAG: hypothetical protein LBP72_02840 [Dysgonamonadaceae bacterium]|jgi:hypothetical protein|nr:hypothetical protein [Dysgonamonadaceae bacterium]